MLGGEKEGMVRKEGEQQLACGDTIPYARGDVAPGGRGCPRRKKTPKGMKGAR